MAKKKVTPKKASDVVVHVVAHQTTEGNKVSYYFKADQACPNAVKLFASESMPIISKGKNEGKRRTSLSPSNISDMIQEMQKAGRELSFKVSKIVYLENSNPIEVGHVYSADSGPVTSSLASLF